MKQFMPATLAMGLMAILTSTPAFAQPSDHPLVPILHISDRYSSCFFDLHPELTQDEFKEFTAELGSILRFRQLGDVAPLGKGRVDIGLHFASTPIDDSKGAWNNTMSHPAADHYLGAAVQFPRLVARYGVSERADIGASGGFDPRSNWGLASIDAKVVVMRQGATRPVSISIRPSLTSLIGPDEVWVGNASIDISVSRTFGRWSPYVGVSTSASLGVERSDNVDLENAWATSSPVYAGLSYRFRALVLSVEAEHGKLPSYDLRVSTRF